jgi:SAM-dependent methyltransferase
VDAADVTGGGARKPSLPLTHSSTTPRGNVNADLHEAAQHRSPEAAVSTPETQTLGSAPAGVAAPPCRFCGEPLEQTFIDLGMSPLCESIVPADRLDEMEPFYPLHVRVCSRCDLVQLPAYVPSDEIFSDYVYFSSYSTSWVEHARLYVESIIDRLKLSAGSFVVELASNDGYLLQHFAGTPIRTLGIEPAANVAEAARVRGVPTLTAFFGTDLARQLVADEGHADLVIGNNVIAHVPDLNDFAGGVAVVLGPTGTATFEFPHLLTLIGGLQYDTIYHEHFSYFSFHTISRVLAAHGLEIYDVEELWTHGGSLRVFAQHADGGREISEAVGALLAREDAEELRSFERYARFEEDVKESKRALLELLIRLRREGKTVVGYGAPGKANTLLNYCGIRTDLLDYTVDRNPHKHGWFTPGTHIPIHPPEMIAETRPDYVVILPWNLVDEIAEQLSYVREWGARLIVPIPTAKVLE